MTTTTSDTPTAATPRPQWQIKFFDPNDVQLGRIAFDPEIGRTLTRVHGVDGKEEILKLTLDAVERVLRNILTKEMG